MLKALIVEKSSILSLDIKNRLIKSDFEVVSVVSEQKQAIKIIKQGQVDFLIVNYNFDAHEIVSGFLRQLKTKFKIPYILLSSSVDNDSIKEMLNFNPESIIPIPFNDKDFKINVLLCSAKIEQKRDFFNRFCNRLDYLNSGKCIIVCNKKGNIKFANRTIQKLLKITKDIRGKRVTDFIKTDNFLKTKTFYKEALEKRKINFQITISVKKDEMEIIGVAEIHEFCFNENAIVLEFDLIEDPKMIKNNSGNYFSVFNELPSPTLVTNKEKVVVFANKAIGRLCNIEIENIIGKAYSELPIVSNIPVISYSDSFSWQTTEKVEIIEFENKNKNHSLLKTQRKIRIDGEELAIQVFTEITSCFQIEEELLKSEKKFRTITNNSQDAIILVNNIGNVEYWNNAAENIIGYTSHEALGKNIDALISHPKYKKQSLKKDFQNFAQTGKGKLMGKTFDAEILTKDRNVLNVIASFNSIRMDNKWYVMAILRNTTENHNLLKELEQTNHFLDVIIENTNVWISFFDEQENIVIWNKAAENISGFRKGEISDLKSLYKLLLPDKTYRESLIKELNSVLRKESNENIPIRIKTNTNKFKSLSLYAKKIKSQSKENYGTIWVAYDITQQSLDEIDFNARIEEKEILIKEIHHRVKNNLQVMNSLINLQSRYIEDNQAIEHFRETQNRIRTMALIQETIYHSKDFTRLNFTEYVEKYSNDLLIFYGFSKEEVNVEIKKAKLYVNINIAVSFALLVNEILTNALKYAFDSESEDNIIKIDFNCTKKNDLIFTISDNGIGIPADVNWKDPDTLGLQLIQILATQIDAEIKQESLNGTKYTILLPAKEITKE